MTREVILSHILNRYASVHLRRMNPATNSAPNAAKTPKKTDANTVRPIEVTPPPKGKLRFSVTQCVPEFFVNPADGFNAVSHLAN